MPHIFCTLFRLSVLLGLFCWSRQFEQEKADERVAALGGGVARIKAS